MRQKVRSRSIENATGGEGQEMLNTRVHTCKHTHDTRIAHANEDVQRRRVRKHAQTTSARAEMRGGKRAHQFHDHVNMLRSLVNVV